MKEIILGIDCGSESSGIIIMEDGILSKGMNLDNEDLFDLIDRLTLFDKKDKVIVVYEDIRPYTSRFTIDTINTCKMIGRLDYVLKQRRIYYEAITRNEVKHFVFNQYNELVVPEIEKKIDVMKKKRKDGKAYKPSFHYVGDRIVQMAMQYQWKQGKPKPGKVNSLGIRTHCWQALGVVTLYMAKNNYLPID